MDNPEGQKTPRCSESQEAVLAQDTSQGAGGGSAADECGAYDPESFPRDLAQCHAVIGTLLGQLRQKGMIKDYHSRITEIIRRYFQDQFYLPALELTTSEVMQYLKQVRRAEIIIDTTFNFLSNADLVKFAKFKPMASVNEEMMKQAVEIVEKTKPVPEKEITAEVSNV